jgi:molecular chaperone GrpE (heat shock protein)
MSNFAQDLITFIGSQIQMQQVVAEMNRKITNLEMTLFGQNQVVDLIPPTLAKLTQALGEEQSALRLLEKAGEKEAGLLDKHYEEHLIEPLVRGLIPLYDMIDESCSRFQEARETTSDAVVSLLDGLRIAFEQFLLIYSVELFRSPASSRLNRQTMQTIQTQPTAEKALDQTVARVLRAGVRRAGRLLRPQSIVLYRYEQVLNGSATSPKPEGNQ